jgi:hypothetical protein
MGEGGGSNHATTNPLEGGGSSRLRRLRVASDAPVFGARRLRSLGRGELWVGEIGGVETWDSQPRLVRGDRAAHASLTELRSSVDCPSESEDMAEYF